MTTHLQLKARKLFRSTLRLRFSQETVYQAVTYFPFTYHDVPPSRLPHDSLPPQNWHELPRLRGLLAKHPCESRVQTTDFQEEDPQV